MGTCYGALAAALLALAISSLVPQAANADPTTTPQWTPPVSLLDTADAGEGEVDLAVGSQSQAVAVWIEPETGAITASTRAVGTTWFKQTLSEDGTAAETPQVEIAANGDVLVVWRTWFSLGTRTITSGAQKGEKIPMLTHKLHAVTYEIDGNILRTKSHAFLCGSTQDKCLTDGSIEAITASKKRRGKRTSRRRASSRQAHATAAADTTTTSAATNALPSDPHTQAPSTTQQQAASEQYSLAPSDNGSYGADSRGQDLLKQIQDARGARDFSIGIDKSGTSVIGWVEDIWEPDSKKEHGGEWNSFIFAAEKAREDRSWSVRKVTTSREGYVDAPDMAVNESGDVGLTWIHGKTNVKILAWTGNQFDLRAQTWNLNRGETTTQTVSSYRATDSDLGTEDKQSGNPEIAINPTGSIALIWDPISKGNFAPGTRIAELATRPSGSGRFSAPTTVANAEAGAHRANVVIGPSGDALVSWEYYVKPKGQTTRRKYAFRFRSASGALAGVETIPDKLDSEQLDPRIVFDPLNRARIVWIARDAASNESLLTSTRDASGQWDAPTSLLTGSLSVPSFQMDENGNAILLVQKDVAGGTTQKSYVTKLDAIGLDAQAPLLMTNPANHRSVYAVKGVEATVQVATADLWGLRNARVEFGDGAVTHLVDDDASAPVLTWWDSASKTIKESETLGPVPVAVANVPHTYDRPGNYFLKTYAKDQFGNETINMTRVRVLDWTVEQAPAEEILPTPDSVQPLSVMPDSPSWWTKWLNSFAAPSVSTNKTSKTVFVDSEEPKIWDFAINRSRFRVGSNRTALSATSKGAKFTVGLSEDATVSIEIYRPGKSMRVGTLIRKLQSGRHGVKFSGRLGKKRLPPGKYRAVATAVDGSGNSSDPARASFKIASR